VPVWLGLGSAGKRFAGRRGVALVDEHIRTASELERRIDAAGIVRADRGLNPLGFEQPNDDFRLGARREASDRNRPAQLRLDDLIASPRRLGQQRGHGAATARLRNGRDSSEVILPGSVA
jgi:hypothetical protein